MESISLQQLEIVKDLFEQIEEAIDHLVEWNNLYKCANDLLISPDGMKTLAADCMLIEAIGEGIKKIDAKTNGALLPLRSEIPWKLVKGMRDHIAHGYFDINVEFVWNVIHDDLYPLKEAVTFFIGYLDNHIRNRY